MSVFDEIKKLEEEKQSLIKRAKDEALASAKKAIADLNQLGFDYKLVAGEDTAATGTRRSGIRKEVLARIKQHPQGIKRADLIQTLDLKGDKRGEQSVSNALSALKRSGAVTQKNDGLYVIAP